MLPLMDQGFGSKTQRHIEMMAQQLSILGIDGNLGTITERDLRTNRGN